MKKISSLFLVAFTIFLASCSNNESNTTDTQKATAEQTVGQSGVQDDASQKNVVQVAIGSKDHTTLVTAVKAGELVDALSNAGPFTVFAPTNDAFNKLPAGTVEGLLKPESKATLTSILTYHVVSGKFEAAAVIEAIEANKGKFEVTTVQGGKITLSLVDGKVVLTDAKGGKATVAIADVAASNGVIHAIDSVVMPK